MGAIANLRGEKSYDILDYALTSVCFVGVAKFFSSFGKEGPRNLTKNAGPVASFHVGVDGPSVGHIANRG